MPQSSAALQSLVRVNRGSIRVSRNRRTARRQRAESAWRTAWRNGPIVAFRSACLREAVRLYFHTGSVIFCPGGLRRAAPASFSGASSFASATGLPVRLPHSLRQRRFRAGDRSPPACSRQPVVAGAAPERQRAAGRRPRPTASRCRRPRRWPCASPADRAPPRTPRAPPAAALMRSPPSACRSARLPSPPAPRRSVPFAVDRRSRGWPTPGPPCASTRSAGLRVPPAELRLEAADVTTCSPVAAAPRPPAPPRPCR